MQVGALETLRVCGLAEPSQGAYVGLSSPVPLVSESRSRLLDRLRSTVNDTIRAAAVHRRRHQVAWSADQWEIRATALLLCRRLPLQILLDT